MTVGFACAVALTGTFTFRSPAADVRSVVERMSKATGLKLSADDRLRDDYVAVGFTDAEPDVALARLADTLNATWVESKDGKTLTRTADQERAEAEHERRMLREKLDHSVAKLRVPKFDDVVARDLDERVEKQRQAIERDPGSVDWRESEKLARQLPMGRFESKVLAAVMSAPLERIPLGKRWVFSLKPTPVQRELPQGCREAYRQLLAETEAFKRVRRRTGTDETEARVRDSVDGLGAAGELSYWTVSVRRDDDWFDIDQQFACEGMSSSGGLYVPIEGRDEKPVRLEVTGTFVPSRTSRAVIAAVGSWPDRSAAGSDKQSQKILVDALAGADGTDPLASTPSEIVGQTAAALGLDYVAALPDYAETVTWALAQSPERSLSAVFGELTDDSGCVVDTSGGYLQMKPGWPTVVRYKRTDRNALREWVRSMSVENLTLDNASRALTTERDSRSSMLSQWAFLPFGDQRRRARWNDFEALRLFGTLDRTTRENAKKAVSTSNLGAMPERFRRELARVLFDEGKGLVVEVQGSGPGEEAEPTTYLTNGLPEGARVRIGHQTRSQLFSRMVESDGSSLLQSLTDFIDVAAVETQVRTVRPEDRPDFRYTPGDVAEIKIIVEFGQGRTATYRTELLPDPEKLTYTGFEGLPADTKKEFEKYWNSLPEHRKKMKPPRTGGPIKPR
ncbi:MAG: hypothetical protein JST30_00200 [Armatimonadetes bacterium]|nr:hypothetical protein [Armatimonadota bacterium]